MKITFYVDGDPKGKERPRFNSKTKTIYTPNTTKEYEQQIGWECKKSMLANRFVCIEVDKEVHMELIIYLKKAMSKPDIDNIAKLVLDALNGIAYKDDRQITNLQIIKKSDKIKRGIEITLWQINQ